MHPFLKFIIRFTLILLIAVIAIKPYNNYCISTNKCQAINLAKFTPSFTASEGHYKIKINFVNINYRPDIEFSSSQQNLFTVTERKNIINYSFKNISKQENPIKFRVKYSVEPPEFAKYIKRSECLCFDSYKLKRGQERKTEMIFKIDKDFDRSTVRYHKNKREIKIKYEIVYE